MREQVAAAPELSLGQVRLGHYEYLHGHPVELIVEDNDALVLVVDGGRFAARDDVAEYTGRVWHRFSVVSEGKEISVAVNVMSAMALTPLADNAHYLISSNIDLDGLDVKR